MYQKVKDVFDNFPKEDQFAAELFKQMRKKSKKLDQIIALEANFSQKEIQSNQDMRKKTESKQSLQSSIDETLQIFSLYKKVQGPQVQAASQQNKENIASEQNKQKQNQENKGVTIGVGNEDQRSLQIENKVVECSILKPRDQVQTASKETQIQSHSDKPQQTQQQQENVVPTQQQYKLLVKESSEKLAEALKSVSSLFLLGSSTHQINMILYNHNLVNLINNEEITVLNTFFFNIMMNMSKSTFEEKIQYATKELLNFVQSDQPVQVQLPHLSKTYTYGDLRHIIDKIVGNRAVMQGNAFGIVTSTGPQVIPPPSGQGLPPVTGSGGQGSEETKGKQERSNQSPDKTRQQQPQVQQQQPSPQKQQKNLENQTQAKDSLKDAVKEQEQKRWRDVEDEEDEEENHQDEHFDKQEVEPEEAKQRGQTQQDQENEYDEEEEDQQQEEQKQENLEDEENFKAGYESNDEKGDTGAEGNTDEKNKEAQQDIVEGGERPQRVFRGQRGGRFQRGGYQGYQNRGGYNPNYRGRGTYQRREEGDGARGAYQRREEGEGNKGGYQRKEEGEGEYQAQRGSYRGNRGNYSRGGYQKNYQDYQQREDRPYYKKPYSSNKFSGNRRNEEEGEEIELRQDMAQDGFEVVKSRADKTKDFPLPYNEQKGPRTAQGALRGRGGYQRGGYRGDRGGYSYQKQQDTNKE